MPRLGQGMAQRADNQPAHQPRIAKAHLGFGRVHVDIHQLRIAIHKQGRNRVAIAAEKIEIGRTQGAQQHFIAHRPAIDEQELRHRRPPRIGGQRRIAAQMHAIAGGIDWQGVFGKIMAQNLR